MWGVEVVSFFLFQRKIWRFHLCGGVQGWKTCFSFPSLCSGVLRLQKCIRNGVEGKIDYAEVALIKTCFSRLLPFVYVCVARQHHSLQWELLRRRSSAAGAIIGNFVCARYLSGKVWPRMGLGRGQAGRKCPGAFPPVSDGFLMPS